MFWGSKSRAGRYELPSHHGGETPCAEKIGYLENTLPTGQIRQRKDRDWTVVGISSIAVRTTATSTIYRSQTAVESKLTGKVVKATHTRRRAGMRKLPGAEPRV